MPSENYDSSSGAWKISLFAVALTFGPAQGRGEGAVAKVDRRALDHVPICVDNNPEAFALVEERQPRASGITINTLFMQAGDLTRAHQKRNVLRRNR
jgi:hypothetical protein